MTAPAAPHICENCGTTENVIFHPSPAGGEYLCFKHTQEHALTKAASEHLFALLNDTFVQWLKHWHNSDPSTLDLAAAADLAVIRLDQMSFSDRKAQIQAMLNEMAAE